MTKHTPDNVNGFDPDAVPAEEWDDYLEAYHAWRRREGLGVFGDDPNDYLQEDADIRLFHEDDEEFFHEHDEWLETREEPPRSPDLTMEDLREEGPGAVEVSPDE
ncbi:MAG: hypothetical protein M3Q71_09000 [Chloroflexota bacterium]|nr:hypothetical protein [Chloroflexota bacterium]